MRENRYPNCSSFAKELERSDELNETALACTEKTIQRDIQTLKHEFKAPIKFDSVQNGYYLTNPHWQFVCPELQDPEVMELMLSGRLIEQIFPEQFTDAYRESVDPHLASSTSDSLKEAYIASLIVGSGVRYPLDPAVFGTVFDGWREQMTLQIDYKTPKGYRRTMQVEPHVLAYESGAWYVKGKNVELPEDDNVRLYAMHRIEAASVKGPPFEIDQALVKGTREGGLFDYSPVKDVLIRYDRWCAGYGHELALSYGGTVTENSDGSVNVNLPKAPSYEILRAVMRQFGEAEVLKPRSLRKRIAEIAGAIRDRHSA